MPGLGAISVFLWSKVPFLGLVIIYVDESGDLGWQFNQPFRAGGSSRYLTVACLIVPSQHRRRPRKIITRLYRKFGWQSERKASDASRSQKTLFCRTAVDLLQQHPEIKLDVITVKKVNVQTHIRRDPNKLYNYMLGLVVPDYVAQETNFDLVTDERSIRVKSLNSLRDYLQVKLWFEIGCPTTVNHIPSDSSKNYSLQFVDWVAHCVWSNYEDGDDSFLKILRPVVRIRPLFF